MIVVFVTVTFVIFSYLAVVYSGHMAGQRLSLYAALRHWLFAAGRKCGARQSRDSEAAVSSTMALLVREAAWFVRRWHAPALARLR